MIKPQQIAPAHMAELSRIQNSVPSAWLSHAMVEVDGYATIREVMAKILGDPEASPEAKEKARAVLDSGDLDQKTQEQDPVVTELIDAYVEKEMLKSVYAKKLPKPKHAPSFKNAYERFTKAKHAYDAKFENEKEGDQPGD